MELVQVQVKAEDFGIEPKKANELIGNLPQIQLERDVLTTQYNEVIKMDIEDEKTSKIAKELRLRIRDNRTKGIDVWHKTTKDYFLKGGQFVDAIKRKEIAVNEKMESTLEEIEKHFENLEKQRIQKIQEKRVELVKPYVDDVSNLTLGNLEEDVFNAYLTAKKDAYNLKIEAIAKAEAEQLALELAEKKRLEEQQLENERLKIEAKKREKEIEDERKKQAELQTELQAKNDAENKAIAENNARILAEAKEAEKLAKAPIKKQMTVWIDSFTYGNHLENETSKEIISKFESFKNWAKLEIEKL